MADSIRTQIVDKVRTRFQAILTAGGYETNLGSNVSQWRNPNLEIGDLPALVLRDLEDEIEEGESTIEMMLHTLSFECEIFTSETSDPDTMRKCFADVAKAIGVDETWDALADRTNPISSTISMQQGTKIIASGLIAFSIEYMTNRWDAYT